MISPQKAAQRLGVSRQTVVNAIKAGRLKAQRNNSNHWIIDPDDLTAWAEDRDPKGLPPSEPPATLATQTYTATLHQKDLQLARLEEQLRASEQKVEDLAGQLARRDADYREAMDMLREAQRPLWVRLRDALRKQP